MYKLGHNHSEETKSKIGKANRNPSQETRDKRSRSLKQYYADHPRTAEANAKVSATKKAQKRSPSVESRERQRQKILGRKHTNEARAKMSEAITNRIFRGEGLPTYRGHGSYFFSHKSNKTFYCRSTYELKAAQILEQMDDVGYYSHEAIDIPYTDEEGHPHRYIPDFWVFYFGGRMEIIEVSSDWQLKEKAIKLEAGRQWCKEVGCDFSVWTEANLGIPTRGAV